ncbi:MAG: hypothetical protein HY961_11840 [Ignavibacteriae bacterium]|nr:hypothetical protein [Ignavibacteriota bacterium]
MTTTSVDHVDRPEHLDQIRDIIFGPQKRELETRLQQLEHDLADARTTLSSDIEKLKKSLTHDLRSTSTNLETQMTSAASSLDAAMKSGNEKLSNELAKLKEQVYRDLEARFADLTDSRVPRERLGELLVELGTNIKSGKRDAELKLVTQKKSG